MYGYFPDYKTCVSTKTPVLKVKINCAAQRVLLLPLIHCVASMNQLL